MRVKMKMVAGILLSGTLMFSAAYIEETDRTVVNATPSSAGVSAELLSNVADTEDYTIVAGVSGVLSEYIVADAATEVNITASQAVTTAAGQQESGAYGYTNLGVASVEGNLNVRKEPGTDTEIVGKMPNEAGCDILGVEGEWTQIRSGKVEGYVKSEYLLSGEAALARADEVKQTIATVDTTTLFVREEPNTECTIITMVPEGEELEVNEELDGWVKISVDEDEGYVSSEYVIISTELKKAMTMTEVRYGQGVSDVRVALVQYATQFVGNPYVWGGTSLTKGADCSGFVLSVFANYGISLPHSSGAQSNCGTRISASEAKPGDLFFYGNGSRINHVAIYIGNGQVVHASSRKTGIKISGAYYRTPVKVVRILGD